MCDSESLLLSSVPVLEGKESAEVADLYQENTGDQITYSSGKAKKDVQITARTQVN